MKVEQGQAAFITGGGSGIGMPTFFESPSTTPALKISFKKLLWNSFLFGYVGLYQPSLQDMIRPG